MILTENTYKCIFNALRAEFKRSHFKKALAHYFRNAESVSASVIKTIFKVCKEAKSPQILLDVFFLSHQAGHKWTVTQAKDFVELLSRFKVYNEDAFTIVNFFITTYPDRMSFDLVVPYLNTLVKNQQFEQMLYFFDRVRTAVSTMHYQMDSELSSTENTSRLVKYEENQLALMKSLLSQFVNYLVSNNLLGQGELLYKNILQKRWLEKEEDYLNGLSIYSSTPDMFSAIYEDYKSNESLEKTSESITKVFSKVSKNILQLQIIFFDIVDTYLLSVGGWLTPGSCKAR